MWFMIKDQEKMKILKRSREKYEVIYKKGKRMTEQNMLEYSNTKGFCQEICRWWKSGEKKSQERA